jgi:hypothetical protein
MEEIAARAALVSAPDVGQGLSTSVSRKEVQEALGAANGSLELILDVTRFDEGGDAAETRNVAVAWDREDLERLLSETEGDRVIFSFDGETLRQAFEADFEAHGLREKALVLAVAATAVAGAAGAASGGVDRGIGVAPTAVTQSAAAATMDVSTFEGLRGALPRGEFEQLRQDVMAGQLVLTSGGAALSADAYPADVRTPTTPTRGTPQVRPTPVQPQLGPDDRSAPRVSPVSEPQLAPDDRAAPRVSPVSEPQLAPDDRAAPRITPAEPQLAPDDRAVPRTSPVSEPTRGTPQVRPTPVPSDRVVEVPTGGTTVTAPSWGETALIAGMILAITGAAFVAAGRRRRLGTT